MVLESIFSLVLHNSQIINLLSDTIKKKLLSFLLYHTIYFLSLFFLFLFLYYPYITLLIYKTFHKNTIKLINIIPKRINGTISEHKPNN